MSTIDVANLSDAESTTTNSANANDVLNNTTTVDTKYITNGCAKAWSNIFGGGTANIRQSLNLSSLADNGTGNYTLTFANAFSSAEYDTQVTGDSNDAQIGCASVTETNTVSAIRTRFYDTGGVATDCVYGGTTIQGELA